LKELGVSAGMANTPSIVVASILPEAVLGFAWGLTIELSGDDDKISTKAHSDEIRNRLSEIRRNAINKITDLKDAHAPPDEIKKAEQDLRYIENILATIDSCERNLVSIIRGRNLNFKQSDELMDAQLQNIASADRLSADLHSAVPRAFASGSGSAAGTVLFSYLLSFLKINVPSTVLYAAAVVFAGVAYWFYQWKFAPINRERAQIEYIKNDYRRDLYFLQYLESVRSTLSALFDEALTTYRKIYGSSYCGTTYDDENNRKTVVSNTLAGRLGLSGEFCKYIHKHYHVKPKRTLLYQKPIITPERWVACETSKGCKECQEYIREENSGH
jgi:hypothetical protein